MSHADIFELGEKAIVKRQNVVDEHLWDVIVDEIMDTYSHLDVLVNKAGICIPGTLESIALEDWRKTQSIKLDSVFVGTRAGIKVMKNKGCSIINMARD